VDITTHQDDEIDRATGDLMVSAHIILPFLIEIGVLQKDATVDEVYYLKRSGWPIGNTATSGGGKLIASKRRLSNHASRLARGSSAA
jgi:hypothetical protein